MPGSAPFLHIASYFLYVLSSTLMYGNECSGYDSLCKCILEARADDTRLSKKV